MSNLVPEQRTDKSGRTQRRWVKADHSRGAKGIPAAASPATQRDADTAHTLAEVTAVLGHTPSLQGRPEAAGVALAVIRRAHGHGRVLGALREGLKGLDDEDEFAGERLRVVEVEHLFAKLPSPPSQFRYVDVGGSARLYVDDRVLDYLPDTAESVELGVALAHMAAACQIRDMLDRQAIPHPSTILYLSGNPALVGVFGEFPGRAMELAEWVIEHGTDAGPARSFMRGEQNTALSDGML